MKVEVGAMDSASGKDTGKRMNCYPPSLEIRVREDRVQNGKPTIELTGSYYEAASAGSPEYRRTCSVRLSLEDAKEIMRTAIEHELLGLEAVIRWGTGNQGSVVLVGEP